MDHAFLCGSHRRTTFVDPVTDLAKAGLKTDRKSVLPGHLQSVVLTGIVGSGDLNGSLEAAIRRPEVYHGGTAQADVINVRTR